MLCRSLAVRCGLVGPLATAVLWAARTAPTMHRSRGPQQVYTRGDNEFEDLQASGFRTAHAGRAHQARKQLVCQTIKRFPSEPRKGTNSDDDDQICPTGASRSRLYDKGEVLPCCRRYGTWRQYSRWTQCTQGLNLPHPAESH